MFHEACKSRVESTAYAVVVIAGSLGAAAVHAVDEPTLSATVIDGSSAYTPRQLFGSQARVVARDLEIVPVAARGPAENGLYSAATVSA